MHLLPSNKFLDEIPAGSVYLVGQFIFVKLSKSPEVIVSAGISDPFFIFREQNMKLLVYLMNVLGLAPYFLDEWRRIRKFRPSTLLFITVL